MNANDQDLDIISDLLHGHRSEDRSDARKALVRIRERISADARALWSVRVLDAWAMHSGRHWSVSRWRYAADNSEIWLVFSMGGGYSALGRGPTPDAARHAAALAVFPSLPADVRSQLGECP